MGLLFYAPVFMKLKLFAGCVHDDLSLLDFEIYLRFIGYFEANGQF